MAFTTLRDGLTLPDEALRLALALEARGHMLSTREGSLLVSDGSKLSAEDRAAVKRLKLHLMAIAEYRTEAP